jgi:hypothetical protein
MVKLELTLELAGNQLDTDISKFLYTLYKARIIDTKIINKQIVAIAPKVDNEKRTFNQLMKILRGLLPGDYHIRSNYPCKGQILLYRKDEKGYENWRVVVKFDGKTLQWVERLDGWDLTWFGVDIADPNSNDVIDKWWTKANS